jgi:hypothetical protein
MSHPLLTAPIGRSLLRLAGPTTALMLMQILSPLPMSISLPAWALKHWPALRRRFLL